jgi:hypothetical protein
MQAGEQAMRRLTQRAPGQSRLPSRWRNRLLPLAAVALVAMMLVTSANSMRVVDNGWERHVDAPIAIVAVSVAGLIEIALLYAILRPWSYHRNWGRALVAALIFAPWTCLVLIIPIPGVMTAHKLWLLAVTVGLLITRNLSFSAARRFGAPGRKPSAGNDAETSESPG